MAATVSDPRALTKKLRTLVKTQNEEIETLHAQSLRAQRLDLNSFHYNVLMGSCRVRGHWRGAVEWLRCMKKDGLQPDVCSINTAIASCKDSGIWMKALLLFHQMPAQCLYTDANGLGATLASCQGEWGLALSLWKGHPNQRTQIGFGAVLNAFQQGKSWGDAVCMLQDLPLTRMKPDLVCYSSSAGSCQMAEEWETATFLLAGRAGLDSVARNCMARAAGTAGRWQEALELGHGGGILERTAALFACSEAALWQTAVGLFASAEPDTIACNTGMTTFRDAAKWQLAIFMIMADETSIHIQIQSVEPVALWGAALQSLTSITKRCLRQGVFSITSLLSTMSSDTGTFRKPWQQAQSCIASMREAAIQLNTASYTAVPVSMWQQSHHVLGCFQELSLQHDIQSHAMSLDADGKALRWMSALSCLTCMRWNSISPDTASCNILINACDQWQWALAMLEETLAPDHMSLGAVMRMCDKFDISFGQHLINRYQNEFAQTPSVSVSILWAMARLTVQDPLRICNSLAQVSQVPLHDLPKLCWAAGTLGVAGSGIARHLEHLQNSLEQLSINELQLIAWGSAAMGTAPHILMAVQDEVLQRIEADSNSEVDLRKPESKGWIEDILGVLWASSFSSCLSRRFQTGARKLTVQAGQFRDRIQEAQIALGRGQARCMDSEMAPSIVADLVDRLVISKPPGWEVHDDGMPKQLRTWLKSLGRWPILSDPDSDFGFLHRLDVPSSGLLLVAKTYEGYYDLQLQLRSGTLARHYVVLNHGCMKRSRIDARLYWKGNSPTRAGGQGKPSRTRLFKLLALAGMAGSTFTMTLVRVLTGRRHQIRSHCMQIGHPTVSDGRYTSTATFQTDTAFCPRNFLHRWSLTHRRDGQICKSKLPLPKDLQEAITSQWKAFMADGALLRAALTRILGAGPKATYEDVKAAIAGDLEAHVQDAKLATWMLSKLARAGRPVAAQVLLQVLQEQRLQINVYHTSSVLTACEKGGLWQEGTALVQDMQLKAITPNQLSFGATISACEKLGLWLQALDVIVAMNSADISPDAISFSAFISACEKGCEWQSAIAFLRSMSSSNVEPNTLSYSGAVSACEKASGSLWHIALDLSMESDRDVVSHSASISACEKAAKWTIALELLLLMPLLRLFANLVTYNAALSACDRRSQWRSLIMLLDTLISQRLQPDLLSFNAAFSACKGQPSAKLLLDEMGRQDLQPDMITFAALQISEDELEAPILLTEMENWQLQLLRKSFGELLDCYAGTKAACNHLLECLEKEFDLEKFSSKKRQKRKIDTCSKALLQQRLQYQKRRRKLEQRRRNQEVPSGKKHRRVENIVLLRVGLAEPSIAFRTAMQIVNEFSLEERQTISHPMVGRARDAFTELVKRQNAQFLRSLFANECGDQPLIVQHIHDGADLRMRSKSVEQAPDENVKIQSHKVTLSYNGCEMPFYTELSALAHKTADCIATSMINILSSLLDNSFGDDGAQSVAKPLNVLHLVTGDGIKTNGAAIARVFYYFHNLWPRRDRILYRVVNWKCASHRANLAVQFVVCGRSRDSDLRANCSRLYKYIMPQYADEIGANLRTFILENLQLEHEEVSGLEDRVDYALLNLYGHGVIPFELVQFLNHDIQRLVHRCPAGTNLAAARGELFAQLYKLVCRVETHPVVTRMWTFTNCIWAMLLCKLLGLPNYIFSTSAVQLRPENERRMQRFRIWWQKPETSSHLRTVSLCLRLTKLAVDLASQKPKEDSNDGARMLPTVVRLGQAAVEKATGALCGSILGRLAADPVLDLTETVQSLLLTQIEIHLRFFDFQLWPACLWRLSIKYNPDGRGQLHWEDRVSSKARRTITHAGDEQRLATYIEDNRQQLEEEAAALRKNAKQKKNEIQNPNLPITNVQWLKYLETYDDDFRKLLKESTDARRRFSERLEPLCDFRAARPLRPPLQDRDPQWMRLLCPKKDGPFYLLKFSSGQKLFAACSRVGALTFAFALRFERSPGGDGLCSLDFQDLTDKCGKVSSLCPNAGNIAPAIYSLQLAVKTITARSLTWMIVDATEIPPGRREELTESGDEAEDLDYDMPVRADDSSDSACSVVSQLESAAENTDDSSLACSEDGQDQAERSAPLPAGTFTIFNNGYFRLMRDPRYTDAKMWLSRKFATPGELGAKELSKTCVLTSDRVNSPLVSLCIAMARPGEADLAASMAEVNVTVDARQQALRALKGWQTKHPGITTSEQMVKLTAATSSALKQKVWVVPKAQLPEIPAALQKAVLDPSTLDQLPPGLARDEAHFLDQVISRTDLPVGTMEWEVSVGVTKTAKNLSEQAALPEIPAQQHDVAPIPASASTEGQSGAPRGTQDGQPALKKPKILCTRPSDESSADTIEHIAEACVKHFEAKNLYCEDKNVVTAEYWIRAFTKHARGTLSASSSDEEYQALSPFPRFIAKSLLQQKDIYPLLHKFVGPLRDLEKDLPKLFPQKGMLQALYVLSETDPGAAHELPLDFLTMQGKNKLVTSSLWAGFMDVRFEKQVEAVTKECQTDAAAALVHIDRLLALRPEDPQLLLGRTVFCDNLTICGSAPQREKVKYLLADKARFELLRLWVPQDDRMLGLEPFSRKDGDFKDALASKVCASLDLLLGCGDVSTVVSWLEPPLAKSMLTLRCKMSQMNIPEELSFFADAVFLDTLCQKLGCKEEPTSQDLP
eukprot:symbB.v1.2.002468.t1/scaffold99.1/size346285/24